MGASIIQDFLVRENVRMLRELSLYFKPLPWYGGGGVDGPPEFLIYCNISKRFCLQWNKPLIFSTR